ncbi:hypothetical protein ACFTY7_25865 [Streptomyces sp. NPDC057062]|uniref:hypothetical protein n=1 Tax=Streptomyces sp. NPDC057062 TaxID=3346011 RepID=UPI0036438926
MNEVQRYGIQVVTPPCSATLPIRGGANDHIRGVSLFAIVRFAGRLQVGYLFVDGGSLRMQPFDR